MNLQAGVVLSVLVTIAGAVILYNPQDYAWIGNQTGYSPAQPINYSHKTHAKDNSIPCEYCHTGARRGPAADIPPANVCMNCHSEVLKNSPEVRKITDAIKADRPIRWVRVHRVPDFVRFNHSAHVVKGVACQTCHGEVQNMPRMAEVRHLSMGWCVGCHRQYTARPPAGMGTVSARVECSTCHY